LQAGKPAPQLASGTAGLERIMFLRWIGLAAAAVMIGGCGLSQMPQLIQENEEAVKASSLSIRENLAVVDESTQSIRRNQQIIEHSTAVIADNAAVIRDSTSAISQNQQAVARMSPAIEQMQSLVPSRGQIPIAAGLLVGVIVLLLAAFVAMAIAALRISAAVRRMEQKR
jgi:hypothetical protein